MKKNFKLTSLIALFILSSVVCEKENGSTAKDPTNREHPDKEDPATTEHPDRDRHDSEDTGLRDAANFEAVLIQSGVPNSSSWVYVKNRAYTKQEPLFEEAGLSLCESVLILDICRRLVVHKTMYVNR